ncbi:hypothetical protein F4778DRAFT_181093 [Xylariomycetidae sp. FL2044]|nr:hypothetical protein F4778DRAFT_181093 [Xylariomycetidae sp. FL2044]
MLCLCRSQRPDIPCVLARDWRRLPDMSAFPSLQDATASLLEFGPEISKVLNASQVLSHGSDSHIRKLAQCSDEFPICKIAIDDRQRRLLQDEFSILQRLSNTPASVVSVHPEPLRDENGIFGFRMENLQRLDSQPLPAILDQTQAAVRALHETGVIHYDLSPSNVMLNAKGHVTLLDFGRSGLTESAISAQKAKPRETAEKYDESLDDNQLPKLFEGIKALRHYYQSVGSALRPSVSDVPGVTNSYEE